MEDSNVVDVNGHVLHLGDTIKVWDDEGDGPFGVERTYLGLVEDGRYKASNHVSLTMKDFVNHSFNECCWQCAEYVSSPFDGSSSEVTASKSTPEYTDSEGTPIQIGDKVWVSDDSAENAKKDSEDIRRLIAVLPGGGGYITSYAHTLEDDADSEVLDKIAKGDYEWVGWDYCVKVQEKKVEKLTVAEICERLGYDVEITK